MELVLDCAFVSPPHPTPTKADRGDFNSDYSLQLAIVFSLYVSMGKHVFAACSLPATYGLSLWLSTLLCDSSSPSEYELSDALNKAAIT